MIAGSAGAGYNFLKIIAAMIKIIAAMITL